MSDQIEIKIDAKKLTPDKFLAGARDFFALVEGVAKNVTSEAIDWSIEVDKGSQIVRMRIQNPTAETKRSLDVVSQGIRSLRGGIRMVPSGFTEKEIGAAKRLSDLSDGENIQSVSIKNGSVPENLTPEITRTVDAILAGRPDFAFGSIEGKIVMLSAKHGLECTVYDPVQRREIACWLQTPHAQEAAEKGYRKRVMAAGLIHYSKEGYAVSITVDEIRIFPPDSDLPTVEQIQQIYEQYK
jgi:hypothetical protein